ncbi:NAD-dependent epimerase [Haloferula helveola]|uniref:NAD-dependent epimerase n=1 Tax=Haloferula helveola TaxID=490095 RepID=A0ABN6HIE3_9BACT|nr:NAD-dependent epimerase [Haloferula helveola]
MKGTVVIFGANGFIGRYLCRHFLQRGREVVAVARRKDGVPEGAMFLQWDGSSEGPWSLALEGAALVVNLAGRSVDCRYNEPNRAEILGSRTGSTRAIGRAIDACSVPPRVWMNASTATWYRHAEDQPQDEWKGEPGEGFSFEVARAWEESFFSAPVPAATRKLALRLGMVMANERGSVFDVLGRLTRSGLGGTMGKGCQRVSWMHMDDVISAIETLEANPLADGVFNLTAPCAPTNRELMAAFREVHAMPIGVPSPRWVLELGARALSTETELVLKSRWVEPHRLAGLGFRWKWPEPVPALADLLERPGLDGFFDVPPRRSVGVRAWTGSRGLSTA